MNLHALASQARGAPALFLSASEMEEDSEIVNGPGLPCGFMHQGKREL